MSVSLISHPQPDAFAGNRLPFVFASDSDAMIIVKVIIAGTEHSFSYMPFGSAGAYRTSAEFGDLFRSYFSNAAITAGEEIISPVDGFFVDYSVSVNDIPVFSGRAYRGGVSKRMFKTLSDNALDLFIYRLQNPDAMFLFSTRTNDRLLEVKESELYPFVFIYPDMTLSFADESGNVIPAGGYPAGQICSMDIALLRKSFAEQYETTPSAISVRTGGTEAFSIRIMPATAGPEHYTIRFRNSIGAFEVLEVTGVATHEPVIGDEYAWESMTGYGFYETRRDRLSLRNVINVQTGYKKRSEHPFVLDAIISEESYFVYPDGTSFRCNITADKPSFRHRMIAPNSILLKITEVTEDQYTTPAVDTSTLDDLGFFDDYFDEYFD